MAMLERYRKPGGFIQLLALIEACPSTKQEKLLETVASEDGLWADTVRSKMLSYERILTWDDETLMEIFGTLQDLTVAVALFAAPEPTKSRLNGFLSHGRRRKIDDMYGSKTPTSGEITASHLKIVEAVRRMATDGYVRFEKCDPFLAIGEDIDDRLLRPSIPAAPVAESARGFGGAPTETPVTLVHSYSPMASQPQAQSSSTAAAPSGTRHETNAATAELQMYKRKVAELQKENAGLRHELNSAKSKLDQIKKIA